MEIYQATIHRWPRLQKPLTCTSATLAIHIHTHTHTHTHPFFFLFFSLHLSFIYSYFILVWGGGGGKGRERVNWTDASDAHDPIAIPRWPSVAMIKSNHRIIQSEYLLISHLGRREDEGDEEEKVKDVKMCARLQLILARWNNQARKNEILRRSDPFNRSRGAFHHEPKRHGQLADTERSKLRKKKTNKQ